MTLEKILEEVVNVTGVTVDDLKKRSRATEEITEAKLLYYEIGRRNGFTYKRIGELVDRKHSSVMTSLGAHVFTPKFKIRLNDILDRLGIKEEEEEEETTPLWNDTFRVVDLSSRYFGTCFMGIDNGEVVAHGCRPKVINAMLDKKRI